MKKYITVISAILIGIGLCAILYGVLRSGDSAELSVRVADNDGKPAADDGSGGPVKIEGTLTKGTGTASDIKGNWPWFRGRDFTNVTETDIEMSIDWKDGLQTLWTIDVGEGYAGPAVYDGKVYIIDYDQNKREDAIRCLSLDDGKEIWRYSYPVKVSRNHGMSRTVPAVDGKYVVTLGPKCHVTCVDAVTGEFKWMINLVAEYGTEVPLWYAGQCPFIDEGRAVIAPGGKAMMIAVDCATGQIVWQTPNPDGWVMTHTSITPVKFAGKKMYVWCGGGKYDGGVAGIDAEDGKVLWINDQWKMRTNVPSPIAAGDDKIFVCAGYGEGSMMMQLVENNGKIEARSLYRLEPEVFGSDQQTPVFYDGFIYGVRPDCQLVCLDVEGNVVWASGKEFVKLGPWAIINGMLYVMDGEGRLTLVKATPKGYEEIAETTVIEGHESWGPIAYVNGRIIVRNLTKMACVKIDSEGTKARIRPLADTVLFLDSR